MVVSNRDIGGLDTCCNQRTLLQTALLQKRKRLSGKQCQIFFDQKENERLDMYNNC
jgi:hypothetical protein